MNRLLLVLLLLASFTTVAEASSCKGCGCQAIAVNQPGIRGAELQTWIKQAVLASFELNYQSIDADLARAKRFYTQQGWQDFTEALNEAKVIQQVEEQKLVITALAPQPVKIVIAGIMGERYHWKAQLPILVRYQQGLRSYQHGFLVDVQLTRRAKTGIELLGIDQIIAKPIS